jgi:hypothetical protein
MKTVRLQIAENGRTLSQAQYALEVGLNSRTQVDPVKCECCGQTVAVYRRSLYGRIVKPLIVMRNLEGKGVSRVTSTDLNAVHGTAGVVSEARFWGLVEGAGRYWWLTDLGRGFVDSKAKVYRSIFVFNKSVVGIPEDSKLVSIKDVLGDNFDLGAIFQNGEAA